MHASAQARTEIGRTREHKAEMFIPHKLFAFIFHSILDLFKTFTKASEDFSHVPAFLHRYNASVIFLVYPH